MSLKAAWARRRARVLERDRRRCTKCDAAGKMEVHHVDHELDGSSLRRDFRKGKLTPADRLASVCRACHIDIHHPPDPERAKWRAYVEAME